VLKASHVRLEVTDLAGVVSEVSGPFTVMGLSQSNGGSVVYPVEPAPALPAGYKVRVLRRVPLEQQTPSIYNVGRCGAAWLMGMGKMGSFILEGI
jgi:hypothetical protein